MLNSLKKGGKIDQAKVRAAALVACSVWTVCVRELIKQTVKNFHAARVVMLLTRIEDNAPCSVKDEAIKAKQIWKKGMPTPIGLCPTTSG